MTKKKGLIDMANVSYATGNISFSEKFSNKYRQLLIDWGSNRNFDFYDFDDLEIVDGLKDGGEFSLDFTGSGRWNWENNLKWLITDDPNYVDTVSEYQKELVQASYQEKEEIEIVFTDYEPGAGFIVDQAGTLNVIKNERGYYELSFNETSNQGYDFNDFNRIELEFEDGYILKGGESEIEEKLQEIYQEYRAKIKGNFEQFKKDCFNYIENSEDTKGGIIIDKILYPDYLLEEVYDFVG